MVRRPLSHSFKKMVMLTYCVLGLTFLSHDMLIVIHAVLQNNYVSLPILLIK